MAHRQQRGTVGQVQYGLAAFVAVHEQQLVAARALAAARIAALEDPEATPAWVDAIRAAEELPQPLSRRQIALLSGVDRSRISQVAPRGAAAP